MPSALITEQKKPGRKPAVEVEVSTYGHPAACPVVNWGWCGWEKLFSTDTISPSPHGVAIPGDGSLNRVRLKNTAPNYVMHQRVASPGMSSDYSSWSQFDRDYAGTALTIAAYNTEVVIYFTGNADNKVYEKKSVDFGQTFGAATMVNSPAGITGTRSLSATYKNITNLCLAFVSAADNILRVARRSGESMWTVYSLTASPAVYGVTMYYDGDYNMIVLINVSNILRLARVIFGDGYRVAQYTFSDIQYLNTSAASVYVSDLIAQYLSSLPPGSDFVTARSEYIKRLRSGR